MKLFFIALFAVFLAPQAFAATGEPPSAANPRYVFKLTYPDAEDAIGEALRQKGAGDKISANISGHNSDALYSYDKPITVEIRGLQFEKGSHHWNASLVFVANGDVVSAIPAAGHYDEMIELPVLKREVRNGEIIGQNDIEIHDFPLNHSRADAVTDMSALIGKSPVRTISPQRPIREHEIASPAIVKKNAIVQMHFNAPGMEISATGQAMVEGAKGDVIDVKNVTSRKIVRAVITGTDSVDILSPGTETSQLTGGSHATN